MRLSRLVSSVRPGLVVLLLVLLLLVVRPLGAFRYTNQAARRMKSRRGGRGKRRRRRLHEQQRNESLSLKGCFQFAFKIFAILLQGTFWRNPFTELSLHPIYFPESCHLVEQVYLL